MRRNFVPHPLLRSPHVQTLLGSRGRQYWVTQRARAVREAAQRVLLSASDGVQLEAWVSRQPGDAATVILIHGWLGHADSSYVLSASAELWAAGFSVIRLNLRDHGDTAHLNEELFNSARLQEVVDAVEQLKQQHATGDSGLVGFSLGGNFALRVARECPLPVIAVCPAIDPVQTMHQIDNGWWGYRLFFVRKWRRALREKQLAFPQRYRFDQALQLNTVSTLTDYFVARHTPYPSTAAYLSAYSLTNDALANTDATIVYTLDDPVIPSTGFDNLPESLTLQPVNHGGHCAFVQSLHEPAWIDQYLVTQFQCRLGHIQV